MSAELKAGTRVQICEGIRRGYLGTVVAPPLRDPSQSTPVVPVRLDVGGQMLFATPVLAVLGEPTPSPADTITRAGGRGEGAPGRRHGMGVE